MFYIQPPTLRTATQHNNAAAPAPVQTATGTNMQLEDRSTRLKQPLVRSDTTFKPSLQPANTASTQTKPKRSALSRWYLSVSVGGRGKLPVTTPLLSIHNENEHTFVPEIYSNTISTTEHMQSMTLAQPNIVAIPVAQPAAPPMAEPGTTQKRVKSEHTQAVESSEISSKKSRNYDVDMSVGSTALSSIDESCESDNGSTSSNDNQHMVSLAAEADVAGSDPSVADFSERQPTQQAPLQAQATPQAQQQYQIGNNQPELTEADIAVVRCGDSDSEELYTCSSFGQDSFFVACNSPAQHNVHATDSSVLAIGIADGVGGWRSKGVDSGIMSRDLMHHAELAVRNKAAITPLDIMNDAYNNVHREGGVEAGSTTACILTITPATPVSELHARQAEYDRLNSNSSSTSSAEPSRMYSTTRDMDDDLTLSEPSNTRSISNTSGGNTPRNAHHRINSTSSVFSTFSPSQSQRHSRNLSSSSVGSTESLLDAFNQRINVDSRDSAGADSAAPEAEPPKLPLQQQRTDNSAISQQDQQHSSDIPTAILHSANLGDSGWVVVRDGKIVARSEFQRTGMTVKQMAVIPPRFRDPALRLCDDKPNDSVLQTHVLLENDIIILGSDGLWDNLVQPEHVLIPFVLGLLRVPVPQASDKIQLAMNQQIESIVHDVILTQPLDLLKAIADTLTRHAVRFMNTQDGKPDDICLVAAQLKRCNLSDVAEPSLKHSPSQSNLANLKPRN